MKILFLGTPDFAAGALEALIRAGHEILGVVTQPDKPRAEAVSQCRLRLRYALWPMGFP